MTDRLILGLGRDKRTFAISVEPGPYAFSRLSCDIALLARKTVEEAVASSALKVGLAATTRGVSRVPGGRVRTAALAIVVPYLSAALAVARPVLAGVVFLTSKSRAVCLGAGEDIVKIGLVAAAVHHVACFGKGVRLTQLITGAVKVSNTHSDDCTLGIVPGSWPDPAARVYGGYPRASA